MTSEYKCHYKVDIRYSNDQRLVVKKIVIELPVQTVEVENSHDINIYTRITMATSKVKLKKNLVYNPCQVSIGCSS